MLSGKLKVVTKATEQKKKPSVANHVFMHVVMSFPNLFLKSNDAIV